jgi:hypothetical protein
VLLDGFQPDHGDQFTLVDGPVTGTFDVLDLPALSDGLSWQAGQTASTYTLTVVPEPGSAAAAAMALLGATRLLARRRGHAR